MKETGLTGKRRSTTIAATPDDGNSQRKRRSGNYHDLKSKKIKSTLRYKLDRLLVLRTMSKPIQK